MRTARLRPRRPPRPRLAVGPRLRLSQVSPMPATPFFGRTRTLFTIHNLAYQGLFDKAVLGRLGLPESLFNMNDLEFFGKVNAPQGRHPLCDGRHAPSAPATAARSRRRNSAAGSTGSSARRAGVAPRHPQRRRLPRSGTRPTDPLIPARSRRPTCPGKKVCRDELARRVRPGGAGRPARRRHGHRAWPGRRASTSSATPSTTCSASALTLVILGTGEQKIQDFLLGGPEEASRSGSGSRSPSTRGSPTRSTPGATSSSSPPATSRAD